MITVCARPLESHEASSVWPTRSRVGAAAATGPWVETFSWVGHVAGNQQTIAQAFPLGDGNAACGCAQRGRARRLAGGGGAYTFEHGARRQYVAHAGLHVSSAPPSLARVARQELSGHGQDLLCMRRQFFQGAPKTADDDGHLLIWTWADVGSSSVLDGGSRIGVVGAPLDGVLDEEHILTNIGLALCFAYAKLGCATPGRAPASGRPAVDLCCLARSECGPSARGRRGADRAQSWGSRARGRLTEKRWAATQIDVYNGL